MASISSGHTPSLASYAHPTSHSLLTSSPIKPRPTVKPCPHFHQAMPHLKVALPCQIKPHPQQTTPSSFKQRPHPHQVPSYQVKPCLLPFKPRPSSLPRQTPPQRSHALPGQVTPLSISIRPSWSPFLWSIWVCRNTWGWEVNQCWPLSPCPTPHIPRPHHAAPPVAQVQEWVGAS